MYYYLLAAYISSVSTDIFRRMQCGFCLTSITTVEIESIFCYHSHIAVSPFDILFDILTSFYHTNFTKMPQGNVFNKHILRRTRYRTIELGVNESCEHFKLLAIN